MEKDKAVPVMLDVWQITSEYAIIEQYDDEIIINFKIWDKNQKEVKDKIGCLTFKGVWSIKYSKHNKTRYYKNEVEHKYKSYYLEIPFSNWLEILRKDRSSYDNNWEKFDKRNYKHYVFQNNSYYIEIIAGDVEFKIKNISRYYLEKWNEPA